MINGGAAVADKPPGYFEDEPSVRAEADETV